MSIVSKHFTELNPCRGDENVLNNFPRKTGCEDNKEHYISEQLTTTELVHGASHMISASCKSYLLSFPVGHGLFYPIRIGYAQWGFCPTSFL